MPIPLPDLGVTTALVPFAVVAISMVAVTVFVLLKVLPRAREPPLLTQQILAVSVLFGGSVLLLALLFVFLDPNGTTAWTWVLLAFNFMMMFPVGLWFVSLVLFEDRRIAVAGWEWPALLAVATTGSEVLMGLLFAVGGAATPLSTVEAFALGLSSIWLYWSMATVMAALVAWAPLSPVERAGSVALVLSSLVAPWIAGFPLVGGIAGAIVMTGLLLLVARRLLGPTTSVADARFLIALSALLLAMAVAAAALTVGHGSPAARLGFGAVMIAGMLGEVGFVVRRCYRGPLAGGVPAGALHPRRVGPGGAPLEAAAPERGAPAR